MAQRFSLGFPFQSHQSMGCCWDTFYTYRLLWGYWLKSKSSRRLKFKCLLPVQRQPSLIKIHLTAIIFVCSPSNVNQAPAPALLAPKSCAGNSRSGTASTISSLSPPSTLTASRGSKMHSRARPQPCLGPPGRCPASHPSFGWEGSPAKIDYSRKLVP